MIKRAEEASQALRSIWSTYGLLHIPYRLLILSKMIDRTASASRLRSQHLTLAEWRVMANLLGTGGSTVNAIAVAAYVDRAEVSRAAGLLEQRGLVARLPHPDSKAKRLLKLTAAGQDIAELISAQRRDFYSYLLEGLTEANRQKLDDLLLHLAVRIEEHDAENGAGQAAA